MVMQEYYFSRLSLKDFEERGVKIDSNWTGLEALTAVAILASKKLEEERIGKEKAKEPMIKSEGLSRSTFCKAFDRQHASSSTICKMGKSLEHDDDEKWVVEYTKQKNSKRSVSITNNNAEKDSKSNKRIKKGRPIVLNLTPDLPKEFKDRIEMMNGSKIALLIQKYLFTTDISTHHNRLSCPVNQMLSKEFLNDDEKRGLGNDGQMLVRLIEPNLQECKLNLTQWAMPKEGKSNCTYSYVLRTEWRNVIARNKLEKGDIIQLWSFRMPADELCLALVTVRKGSEVVEEDSSQSNSSDRANDIQGTEEQDGANNGSNSQSPTSSSIGSTTIQVSNPKN